MSDQKYGVILADPPWSFATYGGKQATSHRSAEDHYSTMSHADLLALPIKELAAKDAALFLWVVDSHFPEALALGRAWGFEFKTCAFIWVKTTRDGDPRMGMGYWSRKETEQLWLFTKGKPKRLSMGVRQLIFAPKREHSRKPDEQYAKIEALVGGPFIEIFARQRYPGWDQYGNQNDLMEVGRIAPPPPVRGPLIDMMTACPPSSD